MPFCNIKAKNIHFSYGKENILKGINFEVSEKDILIIKGPNGSGKSTLIKLLSGLLTVDKGEIEYYVEDKKIEKSEFNIFFGFCSVEQNLYEELTVWENLYFLSKLRGIILKDEIEDYLKKAELFSAKDKYFKNLSSGMRQKVKIISSILHKPPFLFLDEPSTNLDEKGIRFLSDIIEEQKFRGICIIATNNENEYIYGNKSVELGK